jgi:SPRY domain-containing SOCS box protein 3
MSDNETEMSENNNLDDNHSLAIYGCDDKWAFSKRDRSQEVYLSNDYHTAHFHPNWSKGTAGIRGTRMLNKGRYFWELHVSQRVFGTR